MVEGEDKKEDEKSMTTGLLYRKFWGGLQGWVNELGDVGSVQGSNLKSSKYWLFKPRQDHN